MDEIENNPKFHGEKYNLIFLFYFINTTIEFSLVIISLLVSKMILAPLNL